MAVPNSALSTAITVDSSSSVVRGIRLMQKEKVGILFVVEDGNLVGALSERDIAVRVVLRRRNPRTTAVKDVMTSPPVVLAASATVREAVHLMAKHRVRHLPVVSNGSIKGMVCRRHMLRERASDLSQKMDSMVAGFCADGIGG